MHAVIVERMNEVTFTDRVSALRLGSGFVQGFVSQVSPSLNSEPKLGLLEVPSWRGPAIKFKICAHISFAYGLAYGPVLKEGCEAVVEGTFARLHGQ